MSTITSTSMSLPVPVVGVEPGPQYATDVNNCLNIIDGHNHTPGYGVQVPPAGLNINADLPINNNNLTSIRSVRFQSQSAALALSTDIGCLYEVVNDLFYNDGNGISIRITQSGGLAGTPGSISNLTPPASASYVAGSSTFVFQSNTNTPANIDGASFVLRNLTANSKGLTLSPPNAMGADYTLVLPSLPATNSVVTLDTSGNMSTKSDTFLVQTGMAIPFAGSSIPSGYLLCDNSAVSRSTYSALFSVVGTIFGPGNGSTTFNLPGAQNLLFFSSVVSPVPNQVFAYWHMDNPSTAGEPNTIVATGSAYDLVEVGVLASNQGKFGTARGPFSPIKGLAWSASASSSTPFDSFPFAIDGWFNTIQTTEGYIISKGNNNDEPGDQGWLLKMNADGTLTLASNAGTSVTTARTYNDGQWHYYAASMFSLSGSGDMRIYVDNILASSAAGPGTFTPSINDLSIGRDHSLTRNFAGLLDDLSYWNTVPSSWANFETIVNNRWNNARGNLLTTNSVPINYIIKT